MSSHLLNDFINIINEDEIFLCIIKNNKKSSNIKYSYINETLRSYLHGIKKEIDDYQTQWDKYKKYSNTYEFINTTVNYKNKNLCVCSYKPISRSYYKMIEIINFHKFNFPKNMKSFHLAEGPGGFIEALCNIRNNPNDLYHGITLMDSHTDVPKWKKAENFMNKHKNIKLIYGPKNDGNLYLKHNLNFIRQNYSKSMDFITADGGFDYSSDFNAQEESSLNLIFCEILYAIIMQKKGGSFVLKVFDCFTNVMVELVYLLCYLYDEVFFMKPNTSRSANSEKYIVCKNFRDVKNLSSIIETIIQQFQNLDKSTIYKFLSIEVSDFFKNKLEEINYIFGQQQIENISQTINYIKDSSTDDKIEKIKSLNISKCIKWCKKYNMPIEETFIT